MLGCFYHFPCPLCQHDADVSQPDHYRVLPFGRVKMAVFNERPVHNEFNGITINDILIDWRITYPSLEYLQRVWCLHTRCISFVDHLPLPKFHLLLDWLCLLFSASKTSRGVDKAVSMSSLLKKTKPCQHLLHPRQPALDAQ
jgi:hypothetical protein